MQKLQQTANPEISPSQDFQIFATSEVGFILYVEEYIYSSIPYANITPIYTHIFKPF